MNKQEMIEMQSALATIPTTGTHTITMAGCLQFLEEKIREAEAQEQGKPLPEVKAVPAVNE